VAVSSVTGDSLRANELKPEDIVDSVDGTAVDTPEKLLELAKTARVATVVVTRAGKQVTVSQEFGPTVKVEPKYVQPHPFELKISVADVGGPSAGLMLALGIVDKLRPEDLTGGKIIAGTGAIDEAGNVGEIGGVPQKLIAAKRDGATIFLTPGGDCDIAVHNAVEGLTLVKVETLKDALTALEAVRAGQQPELCQAG
jgi:Lon-like protease